MSGNKTEQPVDGSSGYECVKCLSCVSKHDLSDCSTEGGWVCKSCASETQQPVVEQWMVKAGEEADYLLAENNMTVAEAIARVFAKHSPSREQQERQLFLDCDGVLADFDTYAEKIFGLPPRKAEDKHGQKRFWADLQSHEGFYRKLPLMPDAMELFNAVKHLNPIILTGCPLGGWAEQQKLDWAANHFPGVKMITCMSKDKRNYMRPGDVLVDDYLKYRHLWEEAGGVFIHHVSAAISIFELEKIGVIAPSREGEKSNTNEQKPFIHFNADSDGGPHYYRCWHCKHSKKDHIGGTEECQKCSCAKYLKSDPDGEKSNG